MTAFNEPTQWGHTLGNEADVRILPDDTGSTTGLASLSKLFQAINQTPLGAGGKAPERLDFNSLFKILGDYIYFLQNGGVPAYNGSYDYVVGRIVLFTDGNIYKCIQPNTVIVGGETVHVAPDSTAPNPEGTDYWKQLDGEDNSTSLIPNQTIISELPLTDANLHLKDGALLSGSGAYSAYVNLIADLYNGGTASSSFCTEAEWQTSNTNYGFCNKFVYDSVANTVRLPKVNSEHGALIKSYSSGADWYRIYEDGFCEQGGTFASDGLTITLYKPYKDTSYNVSFDFEATSGVLVDTSLDFFVNTSSKAVNQFVPYYFGRNAPSMSTLVLYWTACGYIDISDLQTAPIYEYIVVGTVSKTDIQIDIDNVMTDLALKADRNLTNAIPTNSFANALENANIRTVVETYVNGTSWYRVYSDNWCEQGGKTNAATQVTYLKPYKDNNYTITAVAETTDATASLLGCYNRSTTEVFFTTTNNISPVWWHACGYIS